MREGAVRKGGRVMVERMKRKINRPRVSSEKCSDEFRPSVASSGWSTRTLPIKGSNQVRTRHVPAVWVRVCGPSGDVFPLCFAQEKRDRRRVAAASDGTHPRPGAIQKPRSFADDKKNRLEKSEGDAPPSGTNSRYRAVGSAAGNVVFVNVTPSHVDGTARKSVGCRPFTGNTA